MKITLNGDPFEVAGPLTVGALLSQLEIDSRRVAVEHNLVVLKRALYESTMINEGDQVEIVNVVGGGQPQSQRRGRGEPRRPQKFWVAPLRSLRPLR